MLIDIHQGKKLIANFCNTRRGEIIAYNTFLFINKGLLGVQAWLKLVASVTLTIQIASMCLDQCLQSNKKNRHIQIITH